VSANWRRAPVRGDESAEDQPNRRQQLRRAAHNELTLVCGVVIKLGAAMLVMKGLLWMPVAALSALSGAVAATSDPPQSAQPAAFEWMPGLAVSAQHQARTEHRAR
jgi:hypothetical protein